MPKSTTNVCNNAIKISLINVQCISNKLNIVQVFVADERPDVLCVVEHWCVEEKIKLMNLPGYIQVAYFCRVEHRNGGTAIYVRESLKATELDISKLSSEIHCDVCAVKVTINNHKIGIFSVYRSPAGDFNIFVNTLMYTVQQCVDKLDSLFICGDLNVDYNKTTIRLRNQFRDFLDCFDLKITSFEPTRIFTDSSGNTYSSLLDYILTNVDLKLCKTRTFEPNLADHKAISLDYDNCTLPVRTHSNEWRYIRNVSQDSLNKLSSRIREENFASLYAKSSVDDSFEIFLNTIKFLFEECCPLKRVGSSLNRLNGWITPEIKKYSLFLKDLYWLHSNIRTPRSLQIYKTAKLEYNNLLERTKRKFYVNLLESSHTKNKTLWALVNTETGKTKNTHEISLVLNGSLCVDSVVIARSFCEHFSSIALTQIVECFGDLPSQSCTTSAMMNSNFFFHAVSKDEVEDVIKMLNNKKSTGSDLISTRVLKTINGSISEHFAHLINLSVSAGKFPRILKNGTVIPIYKKGDPQDIVNYRPISILSNFSKVFEKIVLNRMLTFLNKFKVITSSQHGFRPSHSTETAACSFVEMVYKRLDEGLCVAGLFFDLSRAFDSLTFKFMISKYYNLGFRGVFLDWLESYISDRKMSVRVNGVNSHSCDLALGVPQGSVLGPLLFLLFINDLPDHIVANLITLFADDTSVLVTAPSLGGLAESIALIIKMFTDWCRKNKLIVNIEKTVCIHFGLRTENRNPIVVSYGDLSITSSESTKFLGVYVDDGLRWHKHVDIVCKKLNSSYFAINKIKKLIPFRSIIDVYYCLSYPHMSYNIMLWGSSSDINRVLICQKRILRMIFNLHPRTSCRPYFIENKIMTVACIYIFKILLYVQNNLNSFVKLSGCHHYATRNTSVLTVPRHKTSKYECSPSYQSIRLYNRLPDFLKTLSSVKFKKVLKEILLGKCYYSTSEYINDCSLPSWSGGGGE